MAASLLQTSQAPTRLPPRSQDPTPMAAHSTLTFMSVDAAAPTAAPTPVAQTNLATTSDLMTYMVVGIIAIIIAIAIVGVLILRKHP